MQAHGNSDTHPHPHTLPLSLYLLYTATAGGDYNTVPNPQTLTLERGQEQACANIAIYDDSTVEEEEEFQVILSSVTNTSSVVNTFTAGTNILVDKANITIEDDDGNKIFHRIFFTFLRFFVYISGAVVGFSERNYSLAEGGVLNVCIDITSPNATVLSMSDVNGTFNITIIGSEPFFSQILFFTINSFVFNFAIFRFIGH